MTHDNLNQGSEGAGATIPQACLDSFKQFSDALNDLKFAPNVKATTYMLDRLDTVRSILDEYVQARKQEEKTRNLHKDYPLIKPHTLNTEEPRPQRPRATNDQVHQTERRIGVAMHAILNELEKVILKSGHEDEKKAALNAFKVLAIELSNMGIFFEQGRNYANKGTMPDDSDVDSRTSERPGHKALFTRLNNLGLGSKTR